MLWAVGYGEKEVISVPGQLGIPSLSAHFTELALKWVECGGRQKPSTVQGRCVQRRAGVQQWEGREHLTSVLVHPGLLFYNLWIGHYCHLSLSVAYPSGEFCVPNIILQEEKGTHSICRHFRHLLAVKEVWVS